MWLCEISYFSFFVARHRAVTNLLFFLLIAVSLSFCTHSILGFPCAWGTEYMMLMMMTTGGVVWRGPLG